MDPDIPRVELEPFYLWPENVAPWLLFMSCCTQWRWSMDGRTGLDYRAVAFVIEGNVRKPQRRRRFAEIQCMEQACLEAWRELRSQH